MNRKNYLQYIINPLELLRTKTVLQVNPTVIPERKELVKTDKTLFNYSSHIFESKKIETIEETFSFLDTKEVSWINIDGINKNEIEILANHFQIHPLIVEDILSVGQRPKMDEINGVLFCVLNMLFFNQKNTTIETEQISIVIGNNFIISIQEDANRDVFSSLREKIKITGSKVRQNGADFLYYCLIDCIVDNYFLVMEGLGERIELLEEDVVRNPNNRTLVKINNLRKEMILLKRSIGPVRELIHGILRSESDLIEEKTEKYFKDIYDHIIQANELAENNRDMLINIHDLYMSNVNLKLNESIKVMTIVTCLLAPATVIGGIFGMNFESIPMIHNKWGFFASVGLMIFIPAWMMYYFKKKKWF